jgi:hypothetical protein
LKLKTFFNKIAKIIVENKLYILIYELTLKLFFYII